MIDEPPRTPQTLRMQEFDRGFKSLGEKMGMGLSPASPPIERYLRVTVEIPGGSIEAGLERSRGEPLHHLRVELARMIADATLVLNGDGITDDSAAPIIDDLEDCIQAAWPSRAWFAEVWQADECLSQVYAPYGMPRAR
jgi:hypothetical protein